MNDREMVLYLMKKLGREIVEDKPNYLEFDSPIGEDVSFEFDDEGNITDMY